MAGVRVDLFRAGWPRALALGLALWLAMQAPAQDAGTGISRRGGNVPDMGPAVVAGPRGGPTSNFSSPLPTANTPVDTPIDTLVEQQVIELRVLGNESITTEKVINSISTKVGRPFDQATLEKDVRKLATKGWFLDVRPIREQVPGGVRVTFQVVERPTLAYVKYLGNLKITDKKLAKATELKKGSALDPYAVEEGRRKIEELYKGKGYNDVQVTILEGTKKGDRGAIYLIDEGVVQKIWTVKFVGNSIASGGRLKTQVGSKPPILYLFKGQVDRKKIDEDVEKLISYYRSLGFFQARIGREFEFDKAGKWATLTFVINEGPRYIVRDVQFIGNQKFSNDDLAPLVRLKGGEFFDQFKLSQDLLALQDIYGTKGYVFANVQRDLRFLEEPGQLDVVFSFEEGDRYVVGRVNVHIEGENPHTRFNAVLNRLQFRPGDIVNTQKVRTAEMRLKRSSLFVNDPSKGQAPKISFTAPESAAETGTARRNGNPDSFRGQSPDDEPGVKTVDLVVTGKLTPEGQRELASEAKQQPSAPASQPNGNPPPAGSQSNWPPPAPSQGAAPAALPVIRGQGPGVMPGDVDSLWRNDDSIAPKRPTRNPLPGEAAVRPANIASPKPSGSAPATTTAEGQTTYDDIVRRKLSQRGDAARISTYDSLPVPGRKPAAKTTADAEPESAVNANQIFSRTLIIRGQDGGGWGGRSLNPVSPAPQSGSAYPPVGANPSYGGAAGQASGDPASDSPIEPLAPGLGGPPATGPNEFEQTPEQMTPLPMDVVAQETQTGRLMFGVGVNSNAGLVGSVVVDEQNFDYKRVPTTWEEWRNGTAFRGAGQHFRIEAAPGTVVSRYVASFTEPYLFDTNVSFGLNAFFYQRFFNDWTEQRAGGRVTLGYQFRPDITGSVGLRGEAVDIKNPRILIPDLARVLGITQLYGVSFKLINDTRDNTFFPTEGRYIELGFEQLFGTFTFPRATVDMRRFFVVHQRPDGSGRQVLSFYGFAGAVGKNAPIYERFFLGGIGTLRGFYFRGASPTIDTVEVGGDIATYGTVEYTFPITADDMFRGAAFCDAGIDARTEHISGMDVRVAPGLGIRVSVPAMGPAPISIDFAVPVLKSSNDRDQLINFSMGASR
jgi:outer membrane protein insertion porin family